MAEEGAGPEPDIVAGQDATVRASEHEEVLGDTDVRPVPGEELGDEHGPPHPIRHDSRLEPEGAVVVAFAGTASWKADVR